MFSSNKSFHTLNRPQKPFGLVGVDRVLKILLMRDNFQVIQSIVGAVKVFVVYFQSAFNTPVKRFPHYAMRPFAGVLAVAHKINLQVMLRVCARLQRTIRSVANPRLAQLDRMGCGYAGAQKISNLFKGGTVLKHLLGFGDFGGIERLASGNTAHVSKIAHLVQIFKIQNWFPRFHSLTPFNMNGSIA